MWTAGDSREGRRQRQPLSLSHSRPAISRRPLAAIVSPGCTIQYIRLSDKQPKCRGQTGEQGSAILQIAVGDVTARECPRLRDLLGGQNWWRGVPTRIFALRAGCQREDGEPALATRHARVGAGSWPRLVVSARRGVGRFVSGLRLDKAVEIRMGAGVALPKRAISCTFTSAEWSAGRSGHAPACSRGPRRRGSSIEALES
jgi:hypothetical protein